MKIMNSSQVKIALEFTSKNCRALEYKRMQKLVGQADSISLVEELSRFQNSDGGFGKGIEPDFWLPESSPMATTVAFQIMDEIRWENCYELYEKGLAYFEHSYDKNAQRWWAVPGEVNDFPHAPWWHFDENIGRTVIDNSLGNPGAEIVAYLIRHYSFVKNIDLGSIVDSLISNLESSDSESEHEIYCYLKLFEQLDIVGKQKLFPCLESSVRKLMVTDSSKWNGYVPMPTDFIQSPDSDLFKLFEVQTEAALDFIVDSFSETKLWEPAWTWGQFNSEWEIAKKHWIGVLAVKNMRILKNFGRLELGISK